ncbi:MAG TPA: DUF2927 domain-containing protein [Dongiaceae bacterium]
MLPLRVDHLRRGLQYFSRCLAVTACVLCPGTESYAADNSTACDLLRYQFADRVEAAPHLIRWASEIKFFLVMPSQASDSGSESTSESPTARALSRATNIPPALSAFGMVLFDLIDTPSPKSTEARNQQEANAVVKVDEDLFSLSSLGPGERRVLFPSGPTFDKRCVLQMTLKDDVIQAAEINLRSSITETETATCIRELMWRAYGFAGLKEDDPSTGNAVETTQEFLPDRKKEMLALLYNPSLQAGMSRSQVEAALKIASGCR